MALEQPKKVTGGAFGRYMAENRASLLKELPGKPATASIKLGSERFKALSEVEKQKYQKQYDQAKEQYEKDLAAFKASGGEMKKIVKKGKKEKKTTDPNKPKKPAGGAYGCYLAKNRAAFIKECAGKPITEVSKLAGARWKGLSAAEKKPFEEEYAKKKAAYEAAMKEYVPPAGTADDDVAEEDGEDEDDEDEADEEDAEDEDSEPLAKKAKTAKSAGKDDFAAEAKTLGYARQFSTLMENSQVKASRASAQKILEALKTEKGKVVQAKKALLGA